MKTMISLLAVAAFAAPAAANEVNVWSTTFETQTFEQVGPFPFSSAGLVGNGGSTQTALAFPALGDRFYRNDTAGTTIFSVSGLGAHTALRLQFDLAFIDSWDSLNGSPAPDILYVDFASQSYQFTVNNASGTVFDVGPGTVLSTGSNLGYSAYNDTIVRYDFLFAHTDTNFSLSIRFGGNGFQGGADESWAIDNFSLAATNVPEPATWGMLIAGFGLVGATLRRRRAAIA